MMKYFCAAGTLIVGEKETCLNPGGKVSNSGTRNFPGMMVDDASRGGSSPVENPQLLKEMFVSSADPSQKLVPWFSW